MKHIFLLTTAFIFCLIFSSCHSTRKISQPVKTTDSTSVGVTNNNNDSATKVSGLLKRFSDNRINYNSFSAKIKVEYSDSKGKQPDVNAFVRMQKDSVIWISLNATFLNVEALRILMTKDSVYILNKLERTTDIKPISYLEQVVKIPLDLSTMQDLLIGNPIFIGPKVAAYSEAGNSILLTLVGDLFKNDLVISSNTNVIERSVLDDLNIASTRTANLFYSNYETKDGKPFSTSRQITVTDKTKVDIKMDYKQYDFNTNLSFPFNIPPNYKIK
ncbi:MAG: DUF4292 domain-containing protein [Ginsengibacter sp.]